jgi:hypothetical protein
VFDLYIAHAAEQRALQQRALQLTSSASFNDLIKPRVCQLKIVSTEGFAPKTLWPICGQNLQHSTVRRWQRMGKNRKTLNILWWLQLLKRQILTFLPVV